MGHKNGQLGQGERLPARGELATCLIRTLTTATIAPLTADVSILTGEGNEKFLREAELGEEEERKEGGSRRWAGGVLSPLLSDNGSGFYVRLPSSAAGRIMLEAWNQS